MAVFTGHKQRNLMKKIKKAIRIAVGATVASAAVAGVSPTIVVFAEEELDVEIDSENIVREEVFWGDPDMDLTDNISGLDGSIVVTNMEIPKTNVKGEFVGKILLSKDGKTKEVEIPVLVKENPDVKEISAPMNTTPEYWKGLKDYKNSDSIEIDHSKVDTTKKGLYFAKATRLRSGVAKVFYIPVTITDAVEETETQADQFDLTGKIIEEKVLIGGTVDLKDNIRDLPAGAKVDVLSTPSTAVAGDFKGKVKITFSDNSFKEAEIPVKVEANPFKVDYTNVKDEEVVVGGKIDLTDNVRGLPAGTKVTELEKPKSDKAGTFYGKVRVTFPNNTTEDVTIKVIVKEDYKNYKIASKDIRDEEIELGDEIDLTDNIKNLPSGTKVKEKDVPKIEKPGTFYGKVEVVFPDGEKQSVEIKIIATSKYEDYKIKPSDILDEEVFAGDSIDLTDNIKNLPSKSKIKEESVPQTTSPGTFYGKVKVTFADGTVKNIEIKVIVKEKEQPWSITSKDILTEKVNVGGAINLTDNIKNLPDGAKVRPVSIPNTDSPGMNVAKAEIVLKDGKVIPVDIPVEIMGEALPLSPPSVGTETTGETHTVPETSAPSGEAEQTAPHTEITTVNELGKEPYKGEIVKTSDTAMAASKAGSLISLLGASGFAGITGVDRFLKKRKNK